MSDVFFLFFERRGVRQSAEVSNQMTSVERVLEYQQLEPEEEPSEPKKLSEEWPTKGCIEFKNVFYRYFAEADPVLRNLTFIIKPKEKIGKIPNVKCQIK